MPFVSFVDDSVHGMFLSRLTLSLSQKFLLFVLLASVLPLVLVGWFALDISRNAIRAEVDTFTQQLMLEQTRYLELLMQEVESLIANLSTIDEIKQAVGSENPSADDYTDLVTQARIGYILSGYTHLRGLVSIDIFTNRGAHYHVGDTLNVQDTRTAVREAVYKTALSADGQVQWVGIQDNVNANSNYTRVVTAAKMLYATDPRTLNRQPVALLLVNLDPEVFYAHFHAIDLGPDAFIILVDSADRLVYHPNKDLLGSRISPELLGLFHATRGSQVITVDGLPMFVTYNLSVVNGWHLISFIPLEVLNARAASITPYLGAVLALTLVLVSVAALLVGRNTVTPINQITRRFKTLRDGRLDVGLRLPDSRHDELGELAKGFNTFLDSLLAKRRTEQELRESEERYALAVRGANDGIWDWNLKTNRMYFSPRWKGMLGYGENEIGSAPEDWFNRILPEDVERVQSALHAHIRGETPHFESEYRIAHRDGAYRWMLSRGLCSRDETGAAYRIAGSQTDITARVNAQTQLLYDARHDALTGLPNRMLFMERLSRLHEQFVRFDGDSFALLFLDLDRFKVVNDSLGHFVGDQLLVAMARRIENCLRDTDLVARLGGDEIGILLEGATDLTEVSRVAARLLDTVAHPYHLSGREISVTVSIGIAMADRARRLPEDMLRDADTALYTAKADGRARCTIFDADMHTQAVARLELETDLQRAMERQEFELYYQPIVSLESGRVTRVESLLRWRHPQRGLVSPSAFIGLAEETGLIIPLATWGLRTACHHARRWQLYQEHNIRVSVNLSARQFHDQDLPDLMRRVLDDAGLPAAALELEITERTAMRDIEHTIHVLNELHRMGIHISIDDFGESYSALGYLRRFPIDTLKIDRSFIADVVTNPDAAAITSALIAMAHQLALPVIAEGVENEFQAAFLRSVDCDEVQGYFVAHPAPAVQAPELATRVYLRELPVRLTVAVK